MTTDLESPHLLLGAYVLGGLSEADRSTFVRHLRTCSACREELVSVAWVRRCLAQVPPAVRLRLVAELAVPIGPSSSNLDGSGGTPTPRRR